jgi:hypothetical protein
MSSLIFQEGDWAYYVEGLARDVEGSTPQEMDSALCDMMSRGFPHMDINRCTDLILTVRV